MCCSSFSISFWAHVVKLCVLTEIPCWLIDFMLAIHLCRWSDRSWLFSYNFKFMVCVIHWMKNRCQFQNGINCGFVRTLQLKWHFIYLFWSDFFYCFSVQLLLVHSSMHLEEKKRWKISRNEQSQRAANQMTANRLMRFSLNFTTLWFTVAIRTLKIIVHQWNRSIARENIRMRFTDNWMRLNASEITWSHVHIINVHLNERKLFRGFLFCVVWSRRFVSNDTKKRSLVVILLRSLHLRPWFQYFCWIFCCWNESDECRRHKRTKQINEVLFVFFFCTDVTRLQSMKHCYYWWANYK